MAIGPGRYDEVATYVRKRVRAKSGVILIVLDGNKGDGFEVQAPVEVVLKLPKLLRELADSIEADGGPLKS